MNQHPYIGKRGRIGYPVPYDDGRHVRAEGVIVYIGTDCKDYGGREPLMVPFSSVVIRIDSGRYKGEHVIGRLVELTLLDDEEAPHA